MSEGAGADRMSDERVGDEPAGGRRAAMREQYRRQMLDSFGGWSGSLITAIPTIVFVVVNAVSTLRWAIVAAVGSAALLAVYRLARRQSVQQVLSGLVGVVVASLIAARTGQAKGYFLLGIWTSFLYAAIFLGTMVVRRPLVGLVWEFLDPTPSGEASAERQTRWYRRPALLRCYQLATLAGLIVFLARGVVQLALYQRDATGWLAFTRIAMGYPLFVAALGFAVWVVARTRRRLVAEAEAASSGDS